MNLKNAFKHFKLITYHRWLVFKLCCRAGEPWRGLVHDLSKYSPTEFKEGIKYFQGTFSPITAAKKDKGYSEAWLHHRGRNKHHLEYWVDKNATDKTPIIPYPYVVEMVCDKLAAGMVYQKDNWTKEYQLTYWEKEKNKTETNEKVAKFLTEIFTQVANQGVNKAITKKNLQDLYKKCCGK